MHKEPHKKLIGFFILVGFALLIGLISKSVFDKVFTNEENVVVMYFDESVKGLNVGSSVVFKGVEIGKVSKIQLIADPKNLDFSIPVYARFSPNQDLAQSDKSPWEKRRAISAFIQKGLRARLITQSYLTGQLMIELEMLPDTPIVLKEKNTAILEIPTVLSPIGELSKGFQNLPIRRTLETFNSILSQMDDELPRILPQFAQIGERLNKLIEQNAPLTADTLNTVNETLYDISDAAKALRNFADYIERHPEAILKGKGEY